MSDRSVVFDPLSPRLQAITATITTAASTSARATPIISPMDESPPLSLSSLTTPPAAEGWDDTVRRVGAFTVGDREVGGRVVATGADVGACDVGT